MSVQAAMERKLREALAPTRLDLENVSYRHAGHASSPGTGESHFNAVIVSERFRGKSRVVRHRMVYEALAAEMAGPVHALSLTLLTPEEAGS